MKRFRKMQRMNNEEFVVAILAAHGFRGALPPEEGMPQYEFFRRCQWLRSEMIAATGCTIHIYPLVALATEGRDVDWWGLDTALTDLKAVVDEKGGEFTCPPNINLICEASLLADEEERRALLELSLEG